MEVTEVTEIASGIIEVSNGLLDLLPQMRCMDFMLTMLHNNSIQARVHKVVLLLKRVIGDVGESYELSSMYEEGGLCDEIREEFDVIVGDF